MSTENETISKSHANDKISIDLIEGQDSSMTAVSSPIKRKMCCIISTLIIGGIIAGSMTITMLKYYRRMKMTESLTTSTGTLVLEDKIVY
ncbi:unnamed protein product [Adineta ricciae]|uniref:Uncharacterized protein n=1 Tax=Adineta ricciae TaxID=249248 RepID=A0A813X343_ADIRI|nr:unnamed protein product [Adineta ricciae]CAF1503327.1 unnamed protein product [Adineta ricciae]